jgi:dTDP-4-amino-4,6-dideoxygalactose transaminase
MTLARQTPAGERIDLRQLVTAVSSQEIRSQMTAGWMAFGSGTMALAAAMRCAARSQPAGAQVTLPAYSCPDIIAAALFSGLSINFTDLAPQSTGVDPTRPDTNTSSNSPIVVMVDLFGVHSRLPTGHTANGSGVMVIHDRAQALSGPGLPIPQPADFVIVSRGRGKPATLLGGGAVWARNHDEFARFATIEFPLVDWSLSATLLRAVVYNFALRPMPYGAISRLPFLHFGTTRLRTLCSVTRLPPIWLVHAARQLEQQQATTARHSSRTLAIAEVIADCGFRILPDVMETAAREGLNRIPVLCHDARQAEWLTARGGHLGISRMYGKTLPEFLGMNADMAAAAYPNAYVFSRTVVTVPTHTRITAKTLDTLRNLLRDAAP